MGSTFTTFSGQKIKGFAGKEYSLPTYLQFVPGYCVEAVHSQESLGFKGASTINSIYAVSHVMSTTGKRRQQSFSEDNRYFPLLRNHGDVPTKGDPVLLCTIGKINYYLGPLNTINNSPTWNDDLNYKKELTIQNSDIQQNTQRGERGESVNFNKEGLYQRLQKIRNEDLDYGKVVNEVTGDYLIEGRHGNSVRVGSRSNDPYIFISNKRGYLNKFESLSDGSLITITSNGTLAQHFSGYYDVNTEENITGFQLSSDGVENNTYPIGLIHSDLNNGADIQDTIYGYDGNQMLLHSDRITLNSKLDDIFVSSIKDIHIGAGRHLTFTTAGGDEVNNTDSVIFQTSNFNIGNPSRKDMQQMVLGNDLFDVLQTIVEFMGRLQVLTSLGIQTPLTVGKFAGDISPGEPLAVAIQNEIIPIIETMLSAKHNIESNT